SEYRQMGQPLRDYLASRDEFQAVLGAALAGELSYVLPRLDLSIGYRQLRVLHQRAEMAQSRRFELSTQMARLESQARECHQILQTLEAYKIAVARRKEEKQD